MPELPEVESFKKYVDKTSIGKPIELIRLMAPKMLLNTTEKKLKSALVGNSFENTFRHGKFLFIELKKVCKNPTDVITLIQKIMSDIKNKKNIKNFSIKEKPKKSIGKKLNECIILEPNMAGVGINLNKIIDNFL